MGQYRPCSTPGTLTTGDVLVSALKAQNQSLPSDGRSTGKGHAVLRRMVDCAVMRYHLYTLSLIALLGATSCGNDLGSWNAASQLQEHLSGYAFERSVAFRDPGIITCGTQAGLWSLDDETGIGDVTKKGIEAGIYPTEFGRLRSGVYRFRLKDADYDVAWVDMVVKPTVQPDNRLVTFTWKLKRNRSTAKDLYQCLPEEITGGRDKAVFRRFKDGWRLQKLSPFDLPKEDSVNLADYYEP